VMEIFWKPMPCWDSRVS